MKFTVKDAGEVEIERDGDRLILVEARSNQGWEIVLDEDEDAEESGIEEEEDEEEEQEDELEVTFVQTDREVEFEAEIEEGRLAIEIEETWRGIEPGSFTVGEAGEVEIERDGDRLVLVGVRPNDGWDYEVEPADESDVSNSEVEVTFHSGDREAEFEAVIEDGTLEIEIETKEYIDET